MTDTPKHIQQLQLDTWLSKPPMERLRQFLEDNEAIHNFWKQNHSLKDGIKPMMTDIEIDEQLQCIRNEWEIDT